MGKEHEITEMMAREIHKAMVLGGPHYRELKEIFHVLHAVYEKGKEFVEEMVDEGEND